MDKNFSVNSSSLNKLLSKGDSNIILKLFIKRFSFNVCKYFKFKSKSEIEFSSMFSKS